MRAREGSRGKRCASAPWGEDNGFGDIEAALMATDAGALEDGKEVVTLGGTYKGLDTALVEEDSPCSM